MVKTDDGRFCWPCLLKRRVRIDGVGKKASDA